MLAKVKNSDIIYVADLDGTITLSMPEKKAVNFVNRGKGIWVSPNLIQSKVKLRKDETLQTDDIIFTDHFNSTEKWNADLAEMQRIDYQNKLNTQMHLSQKKNSNKV